MVFLRGFPIVEQNSAVYIIERTARHRQLATMKAFDGFLEKPARDSGSELLASGKLSNEMDVALRKHFDEKSKMSVAMNYFAIACPLMPSFLLGAFMLLDKLDNAYDKSPLNKAREFVRNQRGASQNFYIAAMREKMEMEKKKGGLACSRPLEGLGPTSDSIEKKPKKKEIELLFDGKQSERLNGPVLLSKAQTDVQKIVKKKMALESHLEKVSKEQDFGAACTVSARIQELDKALKQLGC